MNDDAKEAISNTVTFILILAIPLLLTIGTGWGLAALYKSYNVWASAKKGQAELAHADWNRQIAIKEAKAKEESAVLLAQAEVERAKGVAKANKIIGESLHNNTEYLKYLWINNLENEKNQVIYVPTETNLPILEATRNIQK